MVISGMQWSPFENQMRDKENFQLAVREKGTGRVITYNGNVRNSSVRCDVMKSPQGIVITQLHYRYDN